MLSHIVLRPELVLIERIRDFGPELIAFSSVFTTRSFQHSKKSGEERGVPARDEACHGLPRLLGLHGKSGFWPRTRPCARAKNDGEVEARKSKQHACRNERTLGTPLSLNYPGLASEALQLHRAPAFTAATTALTMSGLEIAGVIIGGIPLIISALEHYSDGVCSDQE